MHRLSHAGKVIGKDCCGELGGCNWRALTSAWLVCSAVFVNEEAEMKRVEVFLSAKDSC
jgi:hypothetical protein